MHTPRSARSRFDSGNSTEVNDDTSDDNERNLTRFHNKLGKLPYNSSNIKENGVLVTNLETLPSANQWNGTRISTTDDFENLFPDPLSDVYSKSISNTGNSDQYFLVYLIIP